jgi:hypothetical protein
MRNGAGPINKYPTPLNISPTMIKDLPPILEKVSEITTNELPVGNGTDDRS